MEVFRALAAWTECRLAERQPRLAARLARCVRLPSLALPDLYTMGDHPLVSLGAPVLLRAGTRGAQTLLGARVHMCWASRLLTAGLLLCH